MSDDFDDLKAILRAAPPAPASDEARRRAMAAAMDAFDAEAAAETAAADAAARAEDEKIAANLQGYADETRQKGRQTGLMSLLRRTLMNMSLPSTKTMMMGGASLAVLTIAVISVQDQLRTGFGNLGGPAVQESLSTNETASPTEPSDTFAATEPPRPVITGPTSSTSADTKPPVTAPAELGTGGYYGSPGRIARPGNAGVAGGQLRDSTRADDETTGLATAPVEAEEQVRAESELAVNAPPPSPSLAAAPESQGYRVRVQKGAKLQAGAGGTVGQLSMNGRTSAAAEQRLAPKRRVQLGAEIASDPAPAPEHTESGRENFEEVEPNQIKVVTEEPVSTFSIDVDTASYSFMRAAVQGGALPQKNAVRVEELINYFPYDYPVPESRETPFSTNVALMQTPWNDGTKLMRIGIQGYELAAEEKPRSNLVFLIDTSGSMNERNKLPLLIQSFEMLLTSLDPDDTVSIVVYAGSAGMVLEPTKVEDKGTILRSLQRLRAGGSTAGAAGIQLAYQLAEQNFDKDGINRVILATDGDFNVGIQNTEELESYIERKRETGVFLSVLGFGRGNYNDALMQTLAQNGNGTAAYIDTLQEAQKVLVDEAASALFPIAKDVKIQVEFNPATVAEYRLIGYETRLLNREDFNNDKIDAAEIGAGHSVTALYEITPTASEARMIDELRFQATATQDETGTEWNGEVAFVRVRYKELESSKSELIEVPIVTTEDEVEADTEARFAAAVAAFGQLLKGGRYTGEFSFDDVIALANGAKGADLFGYRAEFVRLVRRAKTAAAMDRQ